MIIIPIIVGAVSAYMTWIAVVERDDRIAATIFGSQTLALTALTVAMAVI